MSMGKLVAHCDFFRSLIFVFHLAEDVANDFARKFIDGNLGELGMTGHVIEPVAQVVVLRQVVQVAVLHLQQVCHFGRANANHTFLNLNK